MNTQSNFYQTPYGQWSSILQNGTIQLEYRFETVGLSDALLKFQEKAVFPTLELPGGNVCVWTVAVEKMVPLAEVSIPMAPKAVRSLAARILEELETLHQNGLTMGDFSPWLVWVSNDFRDVALFPTLALDPQVKAAPNGTTAMPFAAADWERPVGSPNPVTADIYGFGCLLWFLLTGTNRKTAQMLASEFDPSLAAWDAFLDGCTRNNPARRFQTFEQVQSQFPAENPAPRTVPVSVPAPPRLQAPPAKPTKPFISRRNLLLGGVGVLGLGALATLTRGCGSIVPGLGTPYRRGYGDTILSYQDRNYEGAKWVKAHTLPESGRDNLINGWDDENYWIYYGYSDDGVLLEYSEYSYSTKTKEIGMARLLPISQDEVLGFRSPSWGFYRVYYINPTGCREFKKRGDGVRTCNAWYKIDTDMYVCHLLYPRNEVVMYYNLAKNETHFVTESDDKYYVHEDNSPNRNWEISEIDCVKTVSAGHAFGMYEDLLVEFKDNIWRKVKSCPFNPQVSYIDFRGGSLKGYVGADDEGHVFRLTEEGTFQMDINSPGKETTMDIVQVWGVDINKFWAMDSTGTIWQWENDNWRQVVRGLRDYSSGEKDFEFTDTWVSPTGITYGVTADELYKLEI